MWSILPQAGADYNVRVREEACMRVSCLLALFFVGMAVQMYGSNDQATLTMLFPAMNWAQALVLACVIRWRTRKRPAV